MGMMSIIVSHFTQSYGRANHKTLMPIKAKVLGKVVKRKARLTKGRPPNQLKANPTPWKLGLHGLKP